MDSSNFSLLITLTFFIFFKGSLGAKFTLVNKCDYAVWPGILGTPNLETTGFELPKATSRSFQVPTGWSGRFWGRTGCNFDNSGNGTCATADCGSTQLECNGNTATPPATLAEFTLGTGAQDFYDVSLVDGYNLPMFVEVNGGSGDCGSTGCVDDLNKKCPAELKVDGGGACRSACDAFGNPEYCCSGAYNSPATCKPSVYSEMFKSACPKSYSYAFDDASSTFTCTGADYTITFCPNFPSLKSAGDPPAAEEENGGTAAVEEANVGSAWLASLATGGGDSSSSTKSLISYPIYLFLFLSFLLVLVTNLMSQL
ncbi:thaumatin-like protein 1 [Euphorbia lathyris]|uniref:thaumatin-like protein 1 n=1 Tax=Euphorbia lathyris TaxID=212925 RepID=UPI003313489B